MLYDSNLLFQGRDPKHIVGMNLAGIRDRLDFKALTPDSESQSPEINSI